MDAIWASTEKWFFKINPSLKFATIASLFIVYLFVHNLNTMIWTAVLFAMLYFAVNGLAGKLAFGLLSLILVFSALSSTAMVFFGKGTHVLFDWYLVVISEESLARGILIGLRTFIFSILGLIMASTTEPVPFFYSLMQQLKVPVRYAYGCLAAFRMLPMMGEELVHIRQAMRVRGLLRKKGMRARYERLKRYTVTMLAQSIRRAQRTAVAMEAKRFSMSQSRTFYYEIGWSRYDLYFLVLIFAAAALGFFLAFWFPLTPYTDVLDQ
ncbi:energy-coupling factor transporter transmembrane protein EcfT [Sporolactobacillus sp. THM7-7]|nr:energy-coupling factor transporter transmembrane protein EcfT [Sporolactobacillus sp. THM7-7]